MSTDDEIEALRKEVYAVLAALTPAQAKALRARFGIQVGDPGPIEEPDPGEEEVTSRALARELAMLKKPKP